MEEQDKQKHYALAEELLAEQNFVAAVVVGAFAMLLSAFAYGIAVATWAFSYGFAAVGIGIVIGVSMQFLGRGVESKFAVVATVFTLSGCVLGKVFLMIVETTTMNAQSPLEVLQDQSWSYIAERSIASFSLVDLVYWFIAVFCAVFLAKRPLSRTGRLAIGLFARRN